MEVKSKAKFSEKTNKEKLIDFESESIATTLVNEMYVSLKKQKNTKLTAEQLAWIGKVENAYGKNKSIEGNIICEVLENAYHYLNSSSKWSEIDNRLYEMLEKIIFLRAKHLALNEFLDNIETAIRSTLSLDFSKKAAICDAETDKRNILNYATFALNMIIEKIESSMVSMKAVNRMLAAPPQSAIILTDTKGNIRFINSIGESLFDVKHNDLLQKMIYPLFKDRSIIQHFIEDKATQINNVRVELHLHEHTVPVLLTASSINTEEDEIEELLFIIKTREQAEKEEQLNAFSKQKNDEKIAPLNSITEMLRLLRSRSEYIDSKHLISFLEESVDIIKKDTQPYNHFISGADNASFTQDPVNIEFIYDSIIEGLSFVDGYNEVTFKKDIFYENDFYSNSVLIYSILQKLITAAIKLRNPASENRIQFTVRDFSNSKLLMILQFTSRTISATDLTQLLEKNTKDLFNINTNDTQLISVKEAIDRLNGSLETYTDAGKHTVFTISLPY